MEILLLLVSRTVQILEASQVGFKITTLILTKGLLYYLIIRFTIELVAFLDIRN
jgi:hypothetical protein